MFLSNGQVIPGGAVDRLGDRTPMYANDSYYSQTAMPLLGQFAAYAAIYKSQLWVGTVVRKLAMATARMPFEIKARVPGTTDSVNEEGPLAELLARPNRNMSGFSLWEWTSSTRDVYGEAFWLKLRDQRGRVRELHPMHPTNVIVRRLDDGSLGYVWATGNAAVSELPVIPQDDVVAFTTYNPDNLTRGLSTLEALRMTLLNEDAARRATASFWQRGARPGMILQTEQTLSPGAVERLRSQADSLYAGADKAGSTAVFEEGIKAQILQLSPEEMQYIESRKLNREEVCAAYDVPPPVVHILDHATFSNITEQLRSQYRDTMAPRFVNFESVIDHQLVPDFYPQFGQVFSRFNMEEVLRGDFETKATASSMLRNTGVATGNEVRGMFGLPRSTDPNMDRVFANAALIPLGAAQEKVSVTEAGPAPAPGEPLDAGELTATPVPALPAPKSARVLVGREGRMKQAGAVVKTWRTDCAAHGDLNGQTAPIDGYFSNGARVPDGCGCDLDFGKET